MPANSNAVATVTIQDQDLLAPGLPNLVQRLAASVTFPSPNAIQYSGYQLVTATTFTALTPGTQNVPFLYVRNANASGSNALTLEYQQTGGVVVITVNLLPGGIFLFANSVATLASPFSTIFNVAVAAFFQAPVIMEYLFAY